jgi:transposase
MSTESSKELSCRAPADGENVKAEWVVDNEVSSVKRIMPWPYHGVEPRVQPCGGRWIWSIGLSYGFHEAPTELEAQRAALEAALAVVAPQQQAVERLRAKMIRSGLRGKNKDKVERALDMKREGMNAQEIGEALGVTKYTVHLWVKKYNANEPDESKRIKLYAWGVTAKRNRQIKKENNPSKPKINHRKVKREQDIARLREIVMRQDDSLNITAIATMLGRTKGWVTESLKDLGINYVKERRRRMIDKTIEMVVHGKTLVEIGAIIGVNIETLSLWLKKEGGVIALRKKRAELESTQSSGGPK